MAERAIHLAQDQSLATYGRDDLLTTLTTMFMRLGDLGQLARSKAMATAQRLLTFEAALHSYHDTFIIIAGLSAVGIVPALWMNARRKTESNAASEPDLDKRQSTLSQTDLEPSETSSLESSTTEAPVKAAHHAPA